MFDKALSSLLTATLVCAALALAVFAAGFALYAVALPLGPAAAAAIVALTAAATVGIIALLHSLRTRKDAQEAAVARVELATALPGDVTELMRKHPLAAIGVSLLGGVVAARNPRLIREAITILRGMQRP